MKIRPDQLFAHTKQPLLTAYLVTGDEHLLRQEATDTLRYAANHQGFVERERFYSDIGIPWGDVLTNAQSLGLFAEKKWLELHYHSNKIDKKEQENIQELVSLLGDDTRLLITAPKYDAKTLRGVGFKAIEEQGALVQVWPINTAQLPRWLQDRLKQVGFMIDRDALSLLTARVEGNLLAAQQEIWKLQLLLPPNTRITQDILEEVVNNNARYSIFTLVDASLNGKADHALQQLGGLQAEGTEAILILWAFTREVRTLLYLAEAKRQGKKFSDACQEHKIWDKRQALYQNALRRLDEPELQQLLSQCADIDHRIKGLTQGGPWQSLETLAIRLAGAAFPLNALSFHL